MLGKTTEYAIRSLVYVYIQNMQGKRPGFKEISQKIDSPESFTAKVMQKLARCGFVSSMKGRGGGFYFDQPTNPLTLLVVIEAVEGKEYFSKCGFGLKHCDDQKPCPIHDDYSQVRDAMFVLVNSQSIQSLADKIKGHKAVLNRFDSI